MTYALSPVKYTQFKNSYSYLIITTCIRHIILLSWMSQTAIQRNVCELLLLKWAYENLIYIFFHTECNYSGFKCLFHNICSRKTWGPDAHRINFGRNFKFNQMKIFTIISINIITLNFLFFCLKNLQVSFCLDDKLLTSHVKSF